MVVVLFTELFVNNTMYKCRLLSVHKTVHTLAQHCLFCLMVKVFYNGNLLHQKLLFYYEILNEL